MLTDIYIRNLVCADEDKAYTTRTQVYNFPHYC